MPNRPNRETRGRNKIAEPRTGIHTDLEIRWKNYRAFEDTEWIGIRPLTVLIGPNNSGKTSVLSPLVLMSQTINSWDAVAPLVTRGPLIDVGMYKDFVHNHNVENAVCFGIRYHGHKATGKVRKPSSYPPGAIEVSFGPGRQNEEMVLSRFKLFDWYMQPLFEQKRNRDGGYTLESSVLKRFSARERGAISKSRPVNFLFSTARTLAGLRSGEERTIPAEYTKSFQIYLGALGLLGEELRDFFRDLSYIGPLRERPRRSYEVEGEMPISVGLRGEHAANLVLRNQAVVEDRLNHWVNRFEFGDRLTIQRISDEYFTLSFEGDKSSAAINIADAGFGASQLLPLIVQALTARQNSLTIAEQPEIHLNPRLQYVLADLFVEMANKGRRVAIETHSEHLLLRLRNLIARGEIKADKVALYFVEMHNGVASTRQIELQQDGHISAESWPRGFFEDSLGESLALATTQATGKHRGQSEQASRSEGKC